MTNSDFKYTDERFADVQMLRYRLNDFESLSLNRKIFIYCLSQATLYGRDITFEQFGNCCINRFCQTFISFYEQII